MKRGVRALPRGRAGKRPSLAPKIDLVLHLAQMYAYAGKEAMFRDALIRDLDMPEGSEQFQQAMAAFREMLAKTRAC